MSERTFTIEYKRDGLPVTSSTGLSLMDVARATWRLSRNIKVAIKCEGLNQLQVIGLGLHISPIVIVRATVLLLGEDWVKAMEESYQLKYELMRLHDTISCEGR